MRSFEIPQGELHTPISEIITDPNRPDAPIEGPVRLVVREPGLDAPIIDAPAEVLDANERHVAYQWQEGETDRAGIFLYRWVEDHPDLGPISYPPTDALLVVVEAVTYATPAGNTVAMFESFHDAAEGGNAYTLRVTLEVASDTVAGMIRLPADADADMQRDFLRRRRNAEMLVARWIWDTDAGQTSSKGSLVGSSISYARNRAVQGIVAGSMGEFLEEEAQAGGDDGTAYVGRL